MPDIRYQVLVDFSAVGNDEVKPLSGVNGGVLTYPKYGLSAGQPRYICDLTTLYQDIGITSVRTHDDVFDVANILRKEGTFASGVAFRDDVQGTVTPYHLSALDDFLTADGSNGYIFSVRTFNAFLETLPFDLSLFDRYDAWLYWFPLSGAAEDPNNYCYGSYGDEGATTGVRSSYDALAKGGFEIYFRVGESFNGPTYVMPADNIIFQISKDRYAFAAAKILEDLSITEDPEAPLPAYPGFIEIWNEPCEIGYHGPYAKGDFIGDPNWDDWSSDFKELTDAICDAVEALGWTVPIGGFGFNRVELKEFVDTLHGGGISKSFAMLRQFNVALLPFVSFHWYRDRTLGSYGTLLLEVLRFPRDLVLLREAVESCVHPELVLEGPPLHITEWNFLTNPDTECNFPDCGIWGAFVSAGLTWMQHPDLKIDRAHFWDGHKNFGQKEDLFGNFYDPPDEGSDLFSVLDTDARIKFTARASAFAMAMHKDLDGDAWIPLTISSYVDAFNTPVDVLDAAEREFEVTAMATSAQDEQRYTIVLTNLASSERYVSLSLDGLAPAMRGQYRIQTWSLDCSSFPADGVFIPGDHSGDYVVPEPGEFQIALDTYIVETDEIVSTLSGYFDDFFVEVPAYGVLRLDLTPAALWLQE